MAHYVDNLTTLNPRAHMAENWVDHHDGLSACSTQASFQVPYCAIEIMLNQNTKSLFVRAKMHCRLDQLLLIIT